MAKSITDEMILKLLDDFGYEAFDEDDDKDPEYWTECFSEYFEEEVSCKACKIKLSTFKFIVISFILFSPKITNY